MVVTNKGVKSHDRLFLGPKSCQWLPAANCQSRNSLEQIPAANSAVYEL